MQSSLNQAEWCSICMEDITSTNNRVATECGHIYHTKCLMKNVAHNGFDCPCCRTKMATAIHDTEYHFNYNMEWYSDLLEGEVAMSVPETVQDTPGQAIQDPTPTFITKKLAEEDIMMEDFVKYFLYTNNIQTAFHEQAERVSIKIQDIIDNYNPDQDFSIDCGCGGFCRACY